MAVVGISHGAASPRAAHPRPDRAAAGACRSPAVRTPTTRGGSSEGLSAVTLARIDLARATMSAFDSRTPGAPGRETTTNRPLRGSSAAAGSKSRPPGTFRSSTGTGATVPHSAAWSRRAKAGRAIPVTFDNGHVPGERLAGGPNYHARAAQVPRPATRAAPGAAGARDGHAPGRRGPRRVPGGIASRALHPAEPTRGPVHDRRERLIRHARLGRHSR